MFMHQQNKNVLTALNILSVYIYDKYFIFIHYRYILTFTHNHKLTNAYLCRFYHIYARTHPAKYK